MVCNHIEKETVIFSQMVVDCRQTGFYLQQKSKIEKTVFNPAFFTILFCLSMSWLGVIFSLPETCQVWHSEQKLLPPELVGLARV